MEPLRIFLSSPSDVADERGLARRLIEQRLRRDPSFRRRVSIEVVSWDDPDAPAPMLAQLTPQEAVDRHLAKPSTCQIVVVILWARMGTPLPTPYRKSDNTPYRSGTEWEYYDALGAVPQPEILVYHRIEAPPLRPNDPDDPKIQETLEQWRQVNLFLARFTSPSGSLLGGVTHYKSPTEFIERLESDLRNLIERRLQNKPNIAISEATRGVAEKPSPHWTGSPYPGLRPFASNEAAIFFGRGAEVDALIAWLRNGPQRILVVVGASGTGKSSIVRAGLLPRLRGGAIEGSQHWPVLSFTPGETGENPFLALASALKSELPTYVQRPPVEIATNLRSEPRYFSEVVAPLLVDRPAGTPVLLFIDQLEELFTLVPANNRRMFVELLSRAAADPHARLVATVRADFLPQCAAEDGLRSLLQAGTFLLGPPGPAALIDMIRGPAERAGLRFEEALPDVIIRDTGGDPGDALPLVAFCLEELYRRTAPEHHITVRAYQDMGGLRGAISRRAGELLDDFQRVKLSDPKGVLPHVFRALVHVDAFGKAARQRAFQADLLDAPLPVPQLVEWLINPGRLLLSEEVGGRAVVSLTHEALLDEWPDLREWLNLNRADLQRVERLLLILKAPEPEYRKFAAAAVGHLDIAAREAMPKLLGELVTIVQRDSEADVRSAIVESLGQMARQTPTAAIASAICIAIDDPDPGVRATAVRSLDISWQDPVDVVPTLATALEDNDLSVRLSARV